MELLQLSTHSVDGVNLLPPLVLLPLDPMLVQVIEQLVDISRSIRISLPLLCVVFQQLNVGQTSTFLYISHAPLTSKDTYLSHFLTML
jgi:hypothetical protein